MFETMLHDLRGLLRLCAGRSNSLSEAIVDARTLQGTLESAGHAGYDGAKKAVWVLHSMSATYGYAAAPNRES